MGPLVDALGREDVVRLSPPGFGAPLPDDFPATYLAYRDWLEGETGPEVGHDRLESDGACATTSEQTQAPLRCPAARGFPEGR